MNTAKQKHQMKMMLRLKQQMKTMLRLKQQMKMMLRQQMKMLIRQVHQNMLLAPGVANRNSIIYVQYMKGFKLT